MPHSWTLNSSHFGHSDPSFSIWFNPQSSPAKVFQKKTGNLPNHPVPSGKLTYIAIGNGHIYLKLRFTDLSIFQSYVTIYQRVVVWNPWCLGDSPFKPPRRLVLRRLLPRPRRRRHRRHRRPRRPRSRRKRRRRRRRRRRHRRPGGVNGGWPGLNQQEWWLKPRMITML